MSDRQKSRSSTTGRGQRLSFDHRLAAYLAATASGTLLTSQAQAVVVSDSTVQPFGINGVVSIDFNSDGQFEWQIDHDRVNLNGTLLDYLQIDKNDVNGETNPLVVDDLLPNLEYENFPLNGTNRDNDAAVLSFTNDFGDSGGYAVALKEGDVIGGSYANPTGSFVPGTIWDWQENSNFLGGGTYIRANRLIDEDAGQIDSNAGRAITVPLGTQPEFPALDDWIGLNGEVRYLGLRVDLNDAAEPGLNNNNPTSNPDFHQQHWYGWIGVRIPISQEADATGEVVGWGYETELGMPINAGETGVAPPLQGDFNGDGAVNAADYVEWRKLDSANTADYTLWKNNFGEPSPGAGGGAGAVHGVPEPSSLLLCLGGAILMLGTFMFGRFRRS